LSSAEVRQLYCVVAATTADEVLLLVACVRWLAALLESLWKLARTVVIKLSLKMVVTHYICQAAAPCSGHGMNPLVTGVN